MEIDRFSLSLFRYILHVDYYLEGRRERKSASIISIQNQKYIKLRNTEGGKKNTGATEHVFSSRNISFLHLLDVLL